LEKNYKRIVVKIGSSLFYSADNTFDSEIFGNLCSQITSLVKEAREVIVVSSGAIALGMQVLGLKDRPKELSDLQAAAAIGQNELMNAYRKFFGKGWFCAQILLTWDDFNDRERYKNAKQTLLALLGPRKYHFQGIVPIINENDTVSTDEIKFGDNDQLSARVSALISADLLIILSDVDGLLDKNKKVIPVIYEITQEIKELANPTNKKTCVGGMVTKIEAAKIAVDSGIPCVIANGRQQNIISLVTKEPERYGTLFIPKKGLKERKRWIAFGTKPKGKIIVDDGAKRALLNQKSLLAVGVIGVEGIFSSGDTVSVVDTQHVEIARGKISVSNKTLEKVKGERFDKEIIHRDNIVIL
jgi:glutamate 5-kinase